LNGTALEPANFKGVQGETVSWLQVEIVKSNKAIKLEPFINNGTFGNKVVHRLPLNSASGYFTAKLENDKGLDTMRLVVDKNHNAVAVIARTKASTGNDFVEANTVPTAQIVSAASGVGAAQQVVAAEVQALLNAGRNATFIGKIATAAAGDASIMGVSKEIAQIVSLALLG
jgi:hypothetical protein